MSGWRMRPCCSCPCLVCRRYEAIWLPLLADAQQRGTASKLYPPIDVQWVWYAHRIAPQAYRDDCTALFGRCLHTSMRHSDPSTAPAMPLPGPERWHHNMTDSPVQSAHGHPHCIHKGSWRFIMPGPQRDQLDESRTAWDAWLDNQCGKDQKEPYDPGTDGQIASHIMSTNRTKTHQLQLG